MSEEVQRTFTRPQLIQARSSICPKLLVAMQSTVFFAVVHDAANQSVVQLTSSVMQRTDRTDASCCKFNALVVANDGSYLAKKHLRGFKPSACLSLLRYAAKSPHNLEKDPPRNPSTIIRGIGSPCSRAGGGDCSVLMGIQDLANILGI